MNFHKQGEHVFNNFVSAVENTKDIAITEVRRKYPKATKEIFNKAYKAHIGDIAKHPLILEGRKLKSQPSGELIDMNSQLFGTAAAQFQKAMADLTRSIVTGIGNLDRCTGNAISAWQEMARAGIDNVAYQRLLQASPATARPKIEDVYRKLSSTLQHEFPLLGRDIIKNIGQDVKEYVVQQGAGR